MRSSVTKVLATAVTELSATGTVALAMATGGVGAETSRSVASDGAHSTADGLSTATTLASLRRCTAGRSYL